MKVLKLRPHEQSQLLMYLEFDGTLHPKRCLWGGSGPYLEPAGGHELFEHARLLDTILCEYPSVRVVLNSVWIEKLGVNGALAHLPAPLRRRVIGTTLEVATPRQPLMQLGPVERILLDVERRKPSGWIALQPEAEGWPGSLDANVVKTHAEEGIAPVLVQAALHSRLLSISLPSRER